MSIDEHSDDIEVTPDYTSTIDVYLDQIDHLCFGMEIRLHPDGSIATFKVDISDSTFQILFSTIEDELSPNEISIVYNECDEKKRILTKNLQDVENPTTILILLKSVVKSIKTLLSWRTQSIDDDNPRVFHNTFRGIAQINILQSVLIAVFNQKIAARGKSTLS